MQMSEYPWYIGSFFCVGVAAIILLVATLVSSLVLVGIEKFRASRRMKKRKYEIEHRFDKPPIAKCHCCDCRHGFATGIDNGDYKPIYRCDLNPNRKKYLYDDSFCSDAEVLDNGY